MDADVENALNVLWGWVHRNKRIPNKGVLECEDAIGVLKTKFLASAFPPPEYYDSPNHGGPRNSTQGIIIHSTRGGLLPGDEYKATINWFLNPSAQVSAHALIAVDGRLAILVDDRLMAWHAQELNSGYIGVELEQGHSGDAISEAQYKRLSVFVRDMGLKYGIGPYDLIEHKDTIQGKRVGKTDVGEPFNLGVLRGYLAAL